MNRFDVGQTNHSISIDDHYVKAYHSINHMGEIKARDEGVK